MNATTQRARYRFASDLRAALDQKGMSVRALAKRLNPQSPETARSNLMRWLRGAHLPSRTSQRAVAVALDLPADHFERGDDDEEEGDLPFALLERAVRLIAREEILKASVRNDNAPAAPLARSTAGASTEGA